MFIELRAVVLFPSSTRGSFFEQLDGCEPTLARFTRLCKSHVAVWLGLSVDCGGYAISLSLCAAP